MFELKFDILERISGQPDGAVNRVDLLNSYHESGINILVVDSCINEAIREGLILTRTNEMIKISREGIIAVDEWHKFKLQYQIDENRFKETQKEAREANRIAKVSLFISVVSILATVGLALFFS